MFHRPDGTVTRLEAIRGGSAATAAANSPGGIFNFISGTGSSAFAGSVKTSTGIQGDNNGILRTDLNIGGPLGRSDWVYNVGGFYRYDKGARDLPFTANKGGQVKANIVKKHRWGLLKFYGKALNDQVIFYKQLPVADLDKAKPFAGFNLKTSSLIVDVANRVPSAADPAATRGYDAGDGIQVGHYAVGAEFYRQLANGWRLANNFKYGYFQFDHFQSSGHNLLSTVSAPNRIHRLSNDMFNSYAYRDAKTGQVVAQYENGALVGASQLGDKVLLTLAKTVTYRVHDVIDQVTLSRTLGQHQFTAGGYFGYGDIDNSLNLDFVLGRFEPNPRLLLLSHPNPFADQPGQPAQLQFTDDKGYFAYGFGTYTNFGGSSRIQALFVNDVWQVGDKLNLDLGLRLEASAHRGKKERWELPTGVDSLSQLPLGLDGDHTTFYDEFFKTGSGDFFDFDFSYAYWSGSLGLNYKIKDNLAAYSRLTRGIKAPEMTYYINNFVNADFEKGFEEEIIQAESGVKLNTRLLSLSLIGFYSRLDNIPFQLLVVSGDVGQFTPATFNSARTIGLEVEAALRPVESVEIDLIATIQDPQFINFNYYNINRTGSDFSDDFIEKFDGNTINEVPRISFDLTPSYHRGGFSFLLNWKYTGERQANRRNTLKLPAFNQFSAGITAKLSQRLSATVRVNNIFNTIGLMNFEGVGIPGTTGEDITPALIENVIVPQNRPYFVRPTLPRSATVSLSANF